MMKYKIDFHPVAIHDYDEIESWLLYQATNAAEKWLSGLIAALYSLEEMPYRFRRIESKHLQDDVRCMVYNPYRIYYRVEENTVLILHIRHTALPPF